MNTWLRWAAEAQVGAHLYTRREAEHAIERAKNGGAPSAWHSSTIRLLLLHDPPGQSDTDLVVGSACSTVPRFCPRGQNRGLPRGPLRRTMDYFAPELALLEGDHHQPPRYVWRVGPRVT